jgi:hypothetical protein
MKRINQYGFMAIMAAVLTLLVIKALTLPVVNDEMPTALTYIHNHVWQIMMYTDNWPNNHILNTLFVKLFVFLFGNTQLVIRLPNLLSFILYGVAIFRINRTILKIDSFFFLPAALLFVSNQFVIDYFSLCRGYGMASAIATLSVSYLVTGFGRSKDKHVWIACIFSILASYANFTLLVFWCATSLMTLLYFTSQRMSLKKIGGPVLIMSGITLIYLALIANPIIKMHSTDEFQYWSSKGFYWDTIFPFIKYSLGARHRFLFPTAHVIAAFIFMTILSNIIFLFFHFKRSKYDPSGLSHPVFVTTALLLATVGINILQCHILKVPNLHGRTALFFYPLFITVFVAFLGLWPAVKARAMQIFVACCFAFICIFHMSNTFKFNWVNDYYFDADTLNVLKFLKTQNGGKPVSLKTTWFCYGSFDYYVMTGKASWLELKDYDKSIDVNTNADYYYLFSKDAKALESKYEPVKVFGDRTLLKKRHPDGVVAGHPDGVVPKTGNK